MKMSMSEEEKFYSFLISIALIAIVILSFTDCVIVTHHPSWSPWYLNAFSPDARQTSVYTTNYSPVFVCILTAIQLLLLWLVRKKFVCIICFLLNIIATVFPAFSKLYLSYSIKRLNDAIYDYESAYNEYVFGTPVYVIIGLGAGVTVLYFILLHFRKKRLGFEEPVKTDDTSNFFTSEKGGPLGRTPDDSL